MSKRNPVSEDDVKKLVKGWFDSCGAWSYAPIQNGLGVHGIHDRIGCVPLMIEPWMVGMTIGTFVSVEAKRPGRRGEARRGMSVHQSNNLDAIRSARGRSIVCDGAEDLELLNDLRVWVLP